MKYKRLRVAIIMGGKSNEREISLNSGYTVLKNLDPIRYQVIVYDSLNDLELIIKNSNKIDIALIMLHGRKGEDGTIQALLELLDIPYQSAGILGCQLAIDKTFAKDCYRRAGLPVIPDIVITKNQKKTIQRILSKFSLPVIIKPAREGSSIGISIIYNKDQFPLALKKGFSLDCKLIVEKYLSGREITCGVLGNHNLIALPLVEIIVNQDISFFNYQAKYTPGNAKEICPAHLDKKTTNIIQKLAKLAHSSLKLKGYSRTDFILTTNGPFIIETNTIPGMTKTSLLPQAAKTAGINISSLIDQLINLALN